jgi:hypothetical protein
MAGPVAGRARTCCADAAQSASLDERELFARSAMLGESSISGRPGHCGSTLATGGGTDAAGGAGSSTGVGGWSVVGVAWSGAKIRHVGGSI